MPWTGKSRTAKNNCGLAGTGFDTAQTRQVPDRVIMAWGEGLMNLRERIVADPFICMARRASGARE